MLATDAINIETDTYHKRKKSERQNISTISYYFHVTLISINHRSTRIIGAVIIIGLLAVAALLMLQKPTGNRNDSNFSSSSSQYNSFFQPNVVSKKIHCRMAGSLPDPGCTPGAMITGITKEHVCSSGYAQSVRNVTDSEKRAVYSAYDIALHAPNQYEIDHFISLELGGSNDIANLWPEPAESKPGFHEKDKVENELHKRVCNGTLSLNEAQRIVATDWVGFYKRITQ